MEINFFNIATLIFSIVNFATIVYIGMWLADMKASVDIMYEMFKTSYSNKEDEDYEDNEDDEEDVNKESKQTFPCNWILTSDKEPDENGSYLCYMEDPYDKDCHYYSMCDYEIITYHKGNKQQYWFECGRDGYNCKVIAYMPKEFFSLLPKVKYNKGENYD